MFLHTDSDDSEQIGLSSLGVRHFVGFAILWLNYDF